MTFLKPSDDGCIEWRTDLDEIAAANRWNVSYRKGPAKVNSAQRHGRFRCALPAACVRERMNGADAPAANTAGEKEASGSA
ncbi:MAG TPA: hypothetical protein VF254_07175 [Gammaproteobacteria bacterium]